MFSAELKSILLEIEGEIEFSKCGKTAQNATPAKKFDHRSNFHSIF
jgi:hypothetical protein